MFGITKTGLQAMRNAFSNPFAIQSVNFSKYLSHSRTKRLPLNTKKVGLSYYKGNRCRKEGRISSKGK